MDKTETVKKIKFGPGESFRKNVFNSDEVVVFRKGSDNYDFSKDDLVLGIFPDQFSVLLRVTRVHHVEPEKLSSGSRQRLEVLLGKLLDSNEVLAIKLTRILLDNKQVSFKLDSATNSTA